MPIINYVSDLHLESNHLSWQVPESADVVVIAGDLWNGNSGLNWLEEFSQTTDKPIIYVPGNHCFWDNDIKLWPIAAKRFCDNIGVYFLYNHWVEIKNTIYLGTTLWTDFNSWGSQSFKMTQAASLMSDYRHITSGGSLITPLQILQEHLIAKEWLNSTLIQHAGRTKCVITHHAPTVNSVTNYGENTKYTPFYVSDLTNLILDHQPDVWIHGHLHHTVGYFVNDTMVVSNPRGHDDHAHDRNDEFTELKLLEF